MISDRAAASLSETVHPQGLVAVCARLDVSLADALARGPRLVAILVEANDPGNAGTILRTADAAGADAVLFAGDSVDPYNGKAVRAAAGSLFHLDVVTGLQPAAAIAGCRAAGLRTLATTGAAALDLDELIDRDGLARADRLGVRQRGPRPARRAGGRGRAVGAGAAARPGREPEPGRGRRRLPVRLGTGQSVSAALLDCW